jgi:hypothetical protein
MIALGVLSLALQVAAAAPAVPVDTPRTRPRAVEVSEWYERRLRLHRYTGYALLPLFAGQWAAGEQLWKHGASAPAWARTGHRVGATAIAVGFTVNTVTGVWNLWESRSVAQGRALRLVHGLSMLAAGAGFTYAGAVLSEQAENSFAKRREHRTVALSSMGVTVTSGLLMAIFNR